MKWKLNQHNVDAAATNKKNLKIDETSIWRSISVRNDLNYDLDVIEWDNNNNCVKSWFVGSKHVYFLAVIFVNTQCN